MATKITDIDQIKFAHLLASSGFIFPRTEQELDSFNELYPDSNYELDNYCIDPQNLRSNEIFIPEVCKHKFSFDSGGKTYFKRVVLAAEIVSQLYNEPTFGHVKFQKLMFLCENIKGMNINYEYSKQAAGPFDNKLMHTIDRELEKQKWVRVEKTKSGNFSRFVFIPLEKFNSHKLYYSHYFEDFDSKIQWFINTFRKAKTDQVELVATLYACKMELVKHGKQVNNSNLISLLYDWSKEKHKYTLETALSTIRMMEDNSIF